MRRALVTGGTGFVGSHAVEALLAGGWTVRALVRNPARLTWLADLPVEIAVGTLDDSESLRAAVRDCDAVVHCAGLTKTVHEDDFLRVNGIRVGVFAAVARDAGVRRFVLCSSQAAGGPSRDSRPVTEDDPPRPVSRYGESKLVGELSLRENAGGMEWIVLRPPSVMGPRDEQFLMVFRAALRYGVLPCIGDPAQAYSIVAVQDLARALRMAAETDRGVNEVYYIACREPVTWAALGAALAGVAARRVRVVPVHWTLVQLAGIASELIARLRGKPLLVSRDKVREILAAGWVCLAEKIRHAWGFECEWTMDRMIRETLDAYRAAHWM